MTRRWMLGGLAAGAAMLPMEFCLAQTPPPPSAGYGEIIVTAQRKTERITDVPLSITALSGESLARSGVGDMRNLGQVTPGLNFQANGNAAQPVIRGIGSTNTSTGDSPNVATYIDGVYMPSQVAGFFELIDLERIEVLKGPQGTLFGRNAAGGAISVTTLTPSFEPTGRIGVGYGRFNDRQAFAYLSSGVTEDIAANLSVSYREDDGFRRDLLTHAHLGTFKSFNVRSKFLFRLGENVTATLTGYYDDMSDLRSFGNQPLDGNTTAGLVPGTVLATRPNTAALTIVPANDTKRYGGSLRVEADLGAAKLTSITAGNKFENRFLTDSDVTPVPASQTSGTSNDHSYSQELILASQGDGDFHWIAGLYYFSNPTYRTLQSFGSTVASGYTAPIQRTLLQNFRTHTKSYAGYGEATYDVTPRFTVTAGARYTHDKTGYTGQNPNPTTGAVLLERSPPDASFTSVTPRVSLRYKFSRELNSYFTYSRGFKGGVFNANGLATAAVDPETVDAFELGLKGSSRRLSFDVSAFRYLYKDQQVSSFGATSIAVILQNVPGTSKVTGIEGNLRYRVIDGLSFSLGGTALRTRYGDYPGPQAFARNFANGGFGNLSVSGLNGRGLSFVRTPSVQAYVGANYETRAAGGTLNFDVFTSYTSRIKYDVLGSFTQAPYSVTNASVSWKSADDHWRATLYGTNIFDKAYLASVLPSNLATAVTYSRPAAYGARLEYLF